MSFPYIISRWLVASGHTDHAFVVHDGTGEVTYATPHMVGTVRWPAVVNLIQGMNPRGSASFDPYKHRVFSTHNTIMGAGMLEFVGLEAGVPTTSDPALQALAQETDPATIWAVIAQRFPGQSIPQPIAITPDNVLRRDEMSFWVNFARGPLPHVNLYGGHHSHLHRIYLMALVENAYYINKKVAPTSGYPIAAMMVNATGAVLGWAANTSNQNYTYHAEVNLVQSVLNRGVPTGNNPIVYTTLQPCVMCAGMIRDHFPNSRVVFLQKDYGVHCKYGVPYFPTGGMHHISAAVPGNASEAVNNHSDNTNTRFKPLRTYNQDQPDDINTKGTGDLANVLDSGLKARWNQGYTGGVISFLKSPAAGEAFIKGAGFLRKYYKYRQEVDAIRGGVPPHVSSEVGRVIAHLAPFLGYDLST